MNILFLSIAAPPKSGAESLQVGRYLKALSAQSSIFLVTTPAISSGWEKIDESQKEILRNVRQVVLQPALNSLGKIGRISGMTILKSRCKKPDDNFLFHMFPTRVKNKLAELPDIIYSRSAPYSSAIFGLKMKKLLNKPWCMHLSDPWTDSPYVDCTNEYNLEAEKNCFEMADLISFTTAETLEFYSGKYPGQKNKFFLTPNVFSSEDVNTDPVVLNNDKLTLLHSGNLYGKRNIAAVLNALKSLNENELKMIELQLVGNMDHQNLEMIESSGLKCINNLGFINADDSLKLQRKADLLVSIDKPLEIPIDKVFLPSKIQDYIAARKRILAITGINSATYRTVNGEYGNCFDHFDTEGLARFIRKSINAFLLKDKSFFIMPEPSQQFDAVFNSRLLLEKFGQLI